MKPLEKFWFSPTSFFFTVWHGQTILKDLAQELQMLSTEDVNDAVAHVIFIVCCGPHILTSFRVGG